MKTAKNDYDINKLKDGIFFATRGGGVRSCVSIGVLKALEEAKIPIKGISGESLSSLFTALYVSGHNSEQILELFLKYNEYLTKSAKCYGGRGSVVIEELVNKHTNNATFKDIDLDCYINACQGKMFRPQLFLFSKALTPNETLGTACRASASIPILFGNFNTTIYGLDYSLFDGGFLYNPYIPETDLPVLYASFHNTINYHKFTPMLRSTIERANQQSDVIIDAPIGHIGITGSNEDMEKAAEAGYEQAKLVLKL